jgi:uncharacterized protein with PQ loop repeat
MLGVRKAIRSITFDRYITVTSVLGNLLFYAQAHVLLRSQSSEDLSLTGFLIATFSQINWLVYGMVRRIWPLMVSSAFGAVGSGLVVMLILRYR